MSLSATGLELARESYLRYNPHGGAIIRQSDLSSWARCQLQKFYYDRARANPDATQPKSLSATVYGTVVHYALMLLERLHHEGREDALDVAVATFEHYWLPENLWSLTGEGIDEWLPRQTYAGLKARGRIAITDYYRLLAKDDQKLLGLEYQFAVPIQIGDRIHTITGTVDRLSVRRHYRKPYLAIEDFKTGKQPTYLRWNVQGSAYGYASTQPEFWQGWAESGCDEFEAFPSDTIDSIAEFFTSWGYRLHEGVDGSEPMASRRFRWINMQEIKVADGGWRTERDYARLKLAVDAYVRACEAGIYSVNNTGEVCMYCAFKKDCGGVGLPHEKAGAP